MEALDVFGELVLGVQALRVNKGIRPMSNGRKRFIVRSIVAERG